MIRKQIPIYLMYVRIDLVGYLTYFGVGPKERWVGVG